MTTASALDLKFATFCSTEHATFEGSMHQALMAAALTRGEAGSPFYRRKQIAAKVDPQQLLERYSLRPGWHITRPDHVTLVVRGGDFFCVLIATGSAKHCTMSFRLWAATPERADSIAADILDEVAPYRMTDSLFRLDWRYTTSRGLKSAHTMERPQDVLLDEAYPSLTEGVQPFIHRFLEAQESVMVLQGPPGMGKTRLVREMLKQMSIRKNLNCEDDEDEGDEYASALYSGDRTVWENDEVFVDFLTEGHEALLIEDADHLITARAQGNETLHRFLNVSDGIARAKGQKIIFSTNLPNIRDLDDALVRPGRCFGHIHLRHFTKAEAHRLLTRLCEGNEIGLESGWKYLDSLQKNHYSVAEVYAAQRQRHPTGGKIYEVRDLSGQGSLALAVGK